MQTHKIPTYPSIYCIYTQHNTETVHNIYKRCNSKAAIPPHVCVFFWFFSSSPNLISSFMCANTMYDQRVSVWIIYVLPSVIYIIIIHNLFGRYIYNVLCCVWLFNERCFADHVPQYAGHNITHNHLNSQICQLY